MSREEDRPFLILLMLILITNLLCHDSTLKTMTLKWVSVMTISEVVHMLPALVCQARNTMWHGLYAWLRPGILVLFLSCLVEWQTCMLWTMCGFLNMRGFKVWAKENTAASLDIQVLAWAQMCTKKIRSLFRRDGMERMRKLKNNLGFLHNNVYLYRIYLFPISKVPFSETNVERGNQLLNGTKEIYWGQQTAHEYLVFWESFSFSKEFLWVWHQTAFPKWAVCPCKTVYLGSP